MRALLTSLLLATAAAVPLVVQAQGMVQPIPGTTAGDRLVTQMRALASNPRDLTALITAGELSLGLDDLSAAAALFARADKIDPRNARVKAGMGSILVRSERPGEALRYFALADSYGIDSRRIASDRGFAYDLIGEQDRAQRDYRTALQGGSIDETDRDETLRRYALSLGISGREAQALEVLDPLLRKTDRGAWRARAFVLAMNGKEADAARIATKMLPAGMAQGLQPFFDRLPALPAIDRAFAVHFGEVHSSAERIADRGMAPTLAALPAEPGKLRAVTVAQASPVPARVRRPATRGNPVLATATPTPMPALPRPVQTAPVQPSATLAARPAQGVPASVTRAAQTVQLTPTPAPVAPARSVELTQVRPTPTPSPASAMVARPTQTAQAQPATLTAARTPEPAPTPTPSLAAVDITPPPAPTRSNEDSVLARIIAGLSIPASELDIAAPSRPVVQLASAAPVTAAHVVAEARAKEARDLAARKLVAERVLADRRATERKLVDRKAVAAKQVADAKKAEEAKEVAAEKKAARANPARIWVQVAGGANERDLAKAWASVKAKAPVVFAGRQPWTTPLRATNRVLAGPFKTDAEARSFVNKLGKNGVSGFTFESDSGQVVTRLAVR